MSEKFEKVFGELKEKTKNFDASSYGDFLAVQITLKDLNEVFFIEVKEGKLTIEPHEYNDRQANIIISADNFVKMMNGKLNSVIAFTTGKLKIEGEVKKAQELSKIFGR
ncbi:MAG: SCP2 sterol-binding domain-containing protein [Oscillospiraceae bacterium]|nr:SCP2 sterol-binding domain-containing protein [Oscillospiraceae bacterium]